LLGNACVLSDLLGAGDDWDRYPVHGPAYHLGDYHPYRDLDPR
jgi:hypothetical protein